MAKTKNLYVCQSCGVQTNKWAGQCGDCGGWNTLVEETITPDLEKQSARFANYAGAESTLTLLKNVKIAKQHRLETGIAEFDHVLGGGLVNDSVILIGGDPGIGKSTLLLQVLCHVSSTTPTLYITGEESLQQVAMRATRLQLPQDDLNMLAETKVERIIAQAEKAKPQIMVIDSIQTVYTEQLSSAPGSVSQVRESAAQLVRYAKQRGVVLVLVGHVTKEGVLAGPRVLEHMVDAVLYFEGQGNNQYRVIRAIKNRFGAVNEIGVFAMTDMGLREVSNPSAIFLTRENKDIAGSVVMVTWEGSRPLLVEIQALVDESQLANPRRVTVGLDHNRLAMLLAVLHRHAGIASYHSDVFINAVGGLRILETGADVAIILAVLSSLKNRPLSSELIVFGELGLAGEIRPVPNGQARLKEAAKHGFTRAIVPRSNCPKKPPAGLEVIPVDRLREAIDVCF